MKHTLNFPIAQINAFLTEEITLSLYKLKCVNMLKFSYDKIIKIFLFAFTFNIEISHLSVYKLKFLYKVYCIVKMKVMWCMHILAINSN